MSAKTSSGKQLDFLHRLTAGYVERGEVSGLVTLVSHRVKPIGMTSLDGAEPMRRDTIFRAAVRA